TYPSRFSPPGAIAGPDQAVGRVLLAGMATGEPLTQTRLAPRRAGPVASLVPEGYRAFAVTPSLPAAAVRPAAHIPPREPPPTVLCWMSTGAVPIEPRNRSSVPVAATEASMSISVLAMVISRSGSPRAPPATRNPVAPTENCPDTGLAPECTPVTSCT